MEKKKKRGRKVEKGRVGKRGRERERLEGGRSAILK